LIPYGDAESLTDDLELTFDAERNSASAA